MASGPKIKKDKTEATLQMKRLKLKEAMDKKVLDTQSIALEKGKEAQADLQNGLGLLSSYIQSRVDQQNQMGTLYRDMATQDAPELYKQAREGAGFLLDYMGGTK